MQREEKVAIPIITPASSEILPADPPTQATETVRRPPILSSYSTIYLTDNPLAVREVRQTGPVTWIPGLHGWCINPSTSFPLTIIHSDKDTACQIREAMDGLVDHYSEDVTEAVAGLVVERGVRFHEFDEYLEAQRQTYRATLATGRGRRTARAQHHDAEIEGELETKALDALDRCCHDVEMLIEGDYPNDPAELAAIRSFGYGNLLRYLGSGPAKVKLIPPGHRRRIGFEAMARAGLAIDAERIVEMPTEALLHAVTLQEIQSLSSRPIPSKSRMKSLAVAFVLGQDGIRERAVTAIDLDAVFYLVPPPSALCDLDLGGMHERMNFVLRATSLVVATYITAALAPTNREYEGKYLAADSFTVYNIRDIFTCPSCRKIYGQSRPLDEWNRFPFHFGCRCSLLIEAR